MDNLLPSEKLSFFQIKNVTFRYKEKKHWYFLINEGDNDSFERLHVNGTFFNQCWKQRRFDDQSLISKNSTLFFSFSQWGVVALTVMTPLGIIYLLLLLAMSSQVSQFSYEHKKFTRLRIKCRCKIKSKWIKNSNDITNENTNEKDTIRDEGGTA